MIRRNKIKSNQGGGALSISLFFMNPRRLSSPPVDSDPHTHLGHKLCKRRTVKKCCCWILKSAINFNGQSAIYMHRRANPVFTRALTIIHRSNHAPPRRLRSNFPMTHFPLVRYKRYIFRDNINILSDKEDCAIIEWHQMCEGDPPTDRPTYPQGEPAGPNYPIYWSQMTFQNHTKAPFSSFNYLLSGRTSPSTTIDHKYKLEA